MRVSKLPARPGCPSPEELAAFIDGRLQGAERERIVEHLASCEDCYAVFTGVVDFNEQESGTAGTDDEEESDDPPARVVPFPVRRAPRWQVPIKLAACLVAGVGGAFLVYSYLYDPGELTAAELVAPFENQAESLRKEVWKKEVTRGPETEDTDFVPALFLLGVHWTDLRMLALSSDQESLPAISREAFGLVANIRSGDELLSPPIWGMDPEVVALVQQLAREPAKLSGPELLQALDDGERRIDAFCEESDLPEFTLGKWAEAGRLAALAEDPTFFARWSKNRRYLRWLVRHHEDFAAVDSELTELWDMVRASDPEELHLGDIASLLEGIIRTYQLQLESPL